MLTTRVGGPADAPAIARLWTVANVARQAHLGLPLDVAAGAVSLSTAEERIRARLAGPGAVLILGTVSGGGAGLSGLHGGLGGGGGGGGGDPVAMALVVQALAQDGASTDPLPGVAHVSMVAVHPDHWGQHLGGVVMAHAQLEARHVGYTRGQLWTQETNHRARRLYERLGWTPSGRTTTDERGESIRHYTRDL